MRSVYDHRPSEAPATQAAAERPHLTEQTSARGRRPTHPAPLTLRALDTSQKSPKRCTRSSRFVTLALVTVPGKGGRPRKWCSDADRVRAYRARQAGRDEPPELDQALAEGDELARAMEEVREVTAELVAAAATEQELRDEVRSLRRELAARDKRFGWLERTSQAQRAARQAAERERDALACELTELRARTRVTISGTRPIAAPSRRCRRRHVQSGAGRNESNRSAGTDRSLLVGRRLALTLRARDHARDHATDHATDRTPRLVEGHLPAAAPTTGARRRFLRSERQRDRPRSAGLLGSRRRWLCRQLGKRLPGGVE